MLQQLRLLWAILTLEASRVGMSMAWSARCTGMITIIAMFLNLDRAIVIGQKTGVEREREREKERKAEVGELRLLVCLGVIYDDCDWAGS